MMDTDFPGYKLTARIEEFRERVIAFCDCHIRPRVMDVEAAAIYPDYLHKRFAEEGLLRAIVPEDCGWAFSGERF